MFILQMNLWKQLGTYNRIISTKHSLLYFFRNIRWLSALISTSYGRNPACISPSAFFKSWTPHHQKPWFRSIWSWSTSCGFQISSFITSRPLRLVGAIKEFQGFRCIFVIPTIPLDKNTFYHVDSIPSDKARGNRVNSHNPCSSHVKT